MLCLISPPAGPFNQRFFYLINLSFLMNYSSYRGGLAGLLRRAVFLSIVISGLQAHSQTDACGGVLTSLTVGTSCTTTSYSIPAGFTNDGPALCTGTSFRDGWYSFTTDAATNSVTITGTSDKQIGLAIYTGVCGSLVQQGCIVPGAANATLNATVTPSTTYFLRISRTNNGNSNLMLGTI